MKKLILFLMLLPLVGVSQPQKIGAVITTNPPTFEMFTYDTTISVRSKCSIIPIYESNLDKRIEIVFKDGKCMKFDFATVIFPKDTAGAVISLVKENIRLQNELDSVKNEAFKDRMRRYDEYVRVIKFLKDAK